jgi:hypothetical protein
MLIVKIAAVIYSSFNVIHAKKFIMAAAVMIASRLFN